MSLFEANDTIQADVFEVLFINELKSLTNVVIGKLGTLVHKQNCSHDFLKMLLICKQAFKILEETEHFFLNNNV